MGRLANCVSLWYHMETNAPPPPPPPPQFINTTSLYQNAWRGWPERYHPRHFTRQFCEEHPTLTGGLASQLRYFLCCQSKQAVELPVNWNALTGFRIFIASVLSPSWFKCKVLSSGEIKFDMIWLRKSLALNNWIHVIKMPRKLFLWMCLMRFNERLRQIELYISIFLHIGRNCTLLIKASYFVMMESLLIIYMTTYILPSLHAWNLSQSITHVSQILELLCMEMEYEIQYTSSKNTVYVVFTFLSICPCVWVDKMNPILCCKQESPFCVVISRFVEC